MSDTEAAALTTVAVGLFVIAWTLMVSLGMWLVGELTPMETALLAGVALVVIGGTAFVIERWRS